MTQVASEWSAERWERWACGLLGIGVSESPGYVELRRQISERLAEAVYASERANQSERRILDVLEKVRYGNIDGAHHKAWVIDQMVRALTGERYSAFVAEACNGEDGPNTHSWDTGTPP